MPSFAPDTEPARSRRLRLRFGAMLLAATVAVAVPAAAERISGHLGVAELTRLEIAPVPPEVAADAIAAAPEPELQAALDWLPVVLAIPRGHRATSATARITDTGETLAAECLGTTGYRGYQVAMVRVARRRDPATPVTGIDVEVETALGGTVPVSILRSEPDLDRATRERLRALVANPADLNAAAPRASNGVKSSRSIAGGGFRPLGDPSLDGSGVRYLIITSAALAPSFQPLADWKTRRGVPATIRTIEWIESRTRRGIDRAETIRNFLVEAYALWGVQWVLLGGDSAIIPARFAWSSLYGGGTSPSDMYFSCLDGNWNRDGDAIWGEGSQSFPPGESDLFPELFVSRAPVNDVAETQQLVSRVIGYETPVVRDYQDKALFLAEVLVPANWDSGMTISFNGAIGTEQMINQSIPPSFQVERLYDTYWQYPGTSKLRRAPTTQSMNAGVGIVNHLGHGFRYTMSCGDLSLVNSDADALVNGARQFILVMANCAAVAFDYNCLAERFLLNPGGGAAGVVGASRSVSASLIVTYNRAFHRQLFEHGHVHLAEALNEMRLERTSLSELDGSDRWIHFCLNALGDPEMTIFTGAVKTPELTHPATLPLAAGTLQVGVASSGSPVAGARVCALKGDEVYAVASTDGAGQVQLAVTPETSGPLFLTVSGANLATQTDTLQVEPPAAAVLAGAGFTLDDDATSPSQGNGDGKADAGETVALSVSVINHGVVAADSVTGTLLSPDPRVTVLQGALTFGTVPASATQTGEAPVVLQLAAGIPDGTGFDLELTLQAAGGAQWSDRVHLQVCAPRLEVTRVIVTAPPVDPFDPHASASIAVETKNYGSGQQPPVVLTWAAFDTTVTVLRDSMQFAAILPHGTANGAPEIEIAQSGPAGPLHFQLADTMGRTWSLRVDPQPPVTPAKPIADLTDRAAQVRLTWPVSTVPDHLGYHVFRAIGGSGNFTRLTPDVVRFGDYYDPGAQPNSNYDYYIVDVDSSHQWSAPSPLLVVNTASATLPGWPLEMNDPTASSPAVGDLDGDGSPEVVVGDNGVYAWHANGQEIRDGDNDGTSHGVFSKATGIMNASVALAPLDAAPGLEIVAASWATNRIYIWNVDGTVLPGWPREPANGGNSGYWASPAIGDVDGDGQSEIVAISKDGWLYAWHVDGTPLIPATNGAVRVVGAWTQTTPALADLDGDGKREIVVSGALGRVDVIRWDGTDFPGWPQMLFAFGKVSPLVADLDGDGDLEIVIGSESDHLYVFEANGTIRPGWPKLVTQNSPDFGPSPALGDLDGDGRLEIVVVSNKTPATASKLFVYDVDGDILLDKQLEMNSQSSPILADLNGDGGIDIVHGGEGGVLHAWDFAGQELSGFPIALGDWIRATPEYCDLNLDGFGDLVVAGWDKKVHVWQMTGPYRPDRAPWPTFHGNHRRDGFLPPHYATPVDETPAPRRFAAVWSPNPFNPSVRLVLSIPDDAVGTPTKARSGATTSAAVTVPVRVTLYDVRGRRVRTLLDAPATTGTLRLTWDGRDEGGRELGSGLYFYRVTAGHHSASGKLTLLR